MVVRQKDRMRPMAQRALDDRTGIKRRFVHRAAHQRFGSDHGFMHIQTDEHNGFHLLAGKERRAVFSRQRAIGQTRLFTPAILLIRCEHAHQRREQHRGAFAHAGHLLQLRRTRVQHARKRAEPIDQRVRQGIDVLPGNGVGQQQLQHLMRLKTFQLRGACPLAQPLSMPFMTAADALLVALRHNASPLLFDLI